MNMNNKQISIQQILNITDMNTGILLYIQYLKGISVWYRATAIKGETQREISSGSQ
jgi:hypothetical protein